MEFTPAEIVEMATLCMSHLDQYSASRIELIGESAALQILPGGPWNLCFHLEKPSIMGIEGVVGTEDSNGYGLVKFSTKYPKVESLGLLDHQGSLPLRDSEAGNFVRRFSFYLFKVQEALHWMLRDLPLLESLKVGMWNSEAISKFLCALPEPPYVSIGKGTHSFNISGLVDANPIRVESCIHGDSLDREKAVAEHRKEVEGTKIALHRLIVAVEGMVKLQPATKTPPDRAHPDGLGDDGTLWHDGRFCELEPLQQSIYRFMDGKEFAPVEDFRTAIWPDNEGISDSAMRSSLSKLGKRLLEELNMSLAFSIRNGNVKKI